MEKEVTKEKIYHYDIALSFAGEDREVVEKIAEILKKEDVKIFYDRYEEVDLWGKNLYEHLADVYSNRARYCILFASEAYKGKIWTNHETSGVDEPCALSLWNVKPVNSRNCGIASGSRSP